MGGYLSGLIRSPLLTPLSLSQFKVTTYSQDMLSHPLACDVINSYDPWRDLAVKA